MNWRRTLLITTVLALTPLVTPGSQPAAAADHGAEVEVERPYREQTFNTPTIGDCTFTTPTVQLCEFVLEGVLIGTHIGRATDYGTGTLTFDFGASCVTPNGGMGIPISGEFSGVIWAADGSELYYQGETDLCAGGDPDAGTTSTWWVTGGTGRFEGASGTMTSTLGVNFGARIIDMSVGTLTY